MKARSKYEHRETVPGPGAYNPSESLHNAVPNCSVARSQRKGLVDAKPVPGPGAYHPITSQVQAAAGRPV